MSVGIFAPGWTFEKVSDLGINHLTTRGTDLCNRNFIERNNRFWALLWPSLYTSPYAQLPFYSSFCLGSGKQSYQDGYLTEQVTSWIKMDLQARQPSVPQQQIEYNFDDSFSGGCSIKFLPGSIVSSRRLFVVDWKLGHGLVVAYAYKSVDSAEHLNLLLRSQSLDGKVTRTECSSEEKRHFPLLASQRRIFPLTGNDLRTVIFHIEAAQEKRLPASVPNGWLVRYYYMTRGDMLETEQVTDIGVGTPNGLGINLGAVYVHSGSEALNDYFKSL